MDTTMIVMIVLFVILLVALYFFNRNRPAAPGTYDDPNYRSGGSIGGGQRTYDDPNFRSSGSIGGSPVENDRIEGTHARSNPEKKVKAYDDKRFKSGGSIGG
jgi:hypothetical protein